MAFDTEHHRFASALDHLAFPWGLPFQISQFPYVMHLDLTVSDATPFTLTCEKAFS